MKNLLKTSYKNLLYKKLIFYFESHIISEHHDTLNFERYEESN